MKKVTPFSEGFRMPAEWERHEATWISWPYNLKTWGRKLEGAEVAMAQYIQYLSEGERIDILVAHEGVEERASWHLQKLGKTKHDVVLHRIESGDVWIRDYGPIFIRNARTKEVAWTKWKYNALGMPEEYADLLPGNEAPNLLPLSHLKKFDGQMVLEGGSIDANGKGTMLTTESCLLSPTRNPSMTRTEIEERLHDYLGITNLLWLSAGIEGDDTSGHVDDVARFVNATTIVTVIEHNATDANYKILKENARRLEAMRDQDGKQLNIVELPMPKKFIVDGRRMAASYANFYIGNACVLVPTYGQDSDVQAIRILEEYFTDRPVKGINCRDFIWGCGSIHCSTQQQAAA